MVDRSPTRRRIVRTAGVAAVAGLAGCTGVAFPGEQSTPDDEPTEAPPTTGPRPTEERETPHDLDSIHLHGTMVLSVNGQTYHFGDKPWNVEERTGNPYFHFHTDGDRDAWHVHAKGVTLGYAVGTMPKLELDGSRVAFRGHTYDAGDTGTQVDVTASGETIEDVDGYRLQDGDEIVIGVQTDAAAPTPTETPAAAGQGVSFPSAAGSTVEGTAYGSGSCGVVLVPQVDLDRGSWEEQATTLAGEDTQVLTIDEGDRPADAVVGAATYLREEQGVDHVVLVGASSGGEAVLEAGADVEPDAIDGIVTLSPAGGAAAAAEIDARLLVVVSREDESRFVETANDVYGAAPDPKRLEVLDGSAHGQRLFDSEQADATTELIRNHVSSVCG